MSLKRDLACPHCECRQVWHIAEMHERGEAAPFEKPIAPLNVVLQQKFFKLYNGVGTFETYICKRCGFTEWYAHGLDDLREDPGNGIFSLDGEEIDRTRGPYRLRPAECEGWHGGDLFTAARVGERGRDGWKALGWSRGELEVRWCPGCGACEWRAHRIAEIVGDDDDELVRVADAVAGGPYR